MRAPGPVFDKAATFDLARQMIDSRYSYDLGLPLLHYHRGEFLVWRKSHYARMEPDGLKAAAYNFLEHLKPKASLVRDVIDGLKAAAYLEGTTAPPTWIGAGTKLPPAGEMISCANGLLHLPSGEIYDHTPEFFGLNAVPFDYDPEAGPPTAWRRFLEQLWPDDDEAIATLQELFGLYLTNDTRHQKIALIVGPKRSGKGTIARVLTALVGLDNCCSPTLAGLSTNFGLAPLIGKQLAIIADARISGRADQAVIAERLLSISGEDNLTVDRKHLEAWTGRIGVRFMLLTNELPRISDVSGALASRFIILTLQQSFYGKEDHGLTDRLLGEMPGILNWAIAGLERLHRRRHLVLPASSRQAVEELEDLSSPIGAFLRQNCVVKSGEAVVASHLFLRWQEWCRKHGRDHPGTTQSFGRDLRAAVPGLTIKQPRDGEKRVRTYEGLRLKRLDEIEEEEQ